MREAKPTPKLLVMCIDDDESVHRAISAHVSCARVVHAYHSHQALQMLQHNQPDLLLLDLDLPEHGGIALLREIRRDNERCPVLILTGNPNTNAALRAGHLGVVDFLQKTAETYASLDQRITAACTRTEPPIPSMVRYRSALHDVGNALNHVATAVSVAERQLQRLQSDKLGRVATMLENVSADSAGNGQIALVPKFLNAFGRQITQDRESVLSELTCISDSVRHMTSIVRDALTGRRHSGSSLDPEQLVAPLVDQALHAVAPDCARLEIEVERDYQEIPPTTVNVEMLLRILGNLLRNAVQAIEEKSRPPRRLVARIRPSEGERIRIEVCDSGIGIARETLEALCQYGFTTKQTGNGIGLHASVQMARELGGILTAHSEGLGHGATFVLDLPAIACEGACQTLASASGTG